MKHGYLIHYSEIGLKGQNRPFFERKLAQNIQNAVFPVTTPLSKAKLLIRLYGRLFLEIPTEEKSQTLHKVKSLTLSPTLGNSDSFLRPALENTRLQNEVESHLQKVFGIAYFSPAILCDTRDPHALKHIVWEEIKKRGQPFKTFRIRASRADKSFHLTSREIEFQIGGFIKEQSKAKVDLEEADLTCFIEILSKRSLIYFDKIPGPGGLPVSTAGKVAVLLSGGIDSPVAAWQMMKRGARCIFVHIRISPQNDKLLQEKIRKLVKKLNEWQISSKLYLVPFPPIHKEIAAQCPIKLRCILCRRMMLRIAERVAAKEGAQALVTGENLGQVASQTLENINATNRVTVLPIFRPLIGFNKQEIIDLARKIGTYEISILPQEDTCALFRPEHPETKAKIKKVENAEEKLEIEKSIEDVLKETTRESFEIPR